MANPRQSFNRFILTASCFLLIITCSFINILRPQPDSNPAVKLIILDPGHGHATFMQGSMNSEIDSEVYVYAPEGPDVKQYVSSINRSNARKSNPTNWKLIVYTEPDYLKKMISDKKGNTVLISGNNSKKSEYITKSINAGFHVIADKPMAITDFKSLEKSFKTAADKKLVLFDPMDLRYDISNLLQKEL